MIFASPVFLFYFLPLVLAGHQLLPWLRLKNLWLLLASLLFYAWGEPAHLPVMLGAILFNWAFALAIARSRGPQARFAFLCLGVGGDLMLLVRYKYATFLAGSLAAALAPLGLAVPAPEPVALPVGISFYLFQILSYLVDVYRGDTEAQADPTQLALYLALFPQLIAGPIVRYRDVAARLVARTVTLEGFGEGSRRFIEGLAKKVLLANPLAATADAAFGLAPERLTGPLAWAGLVAYSLQIYFDFSGYSDMAIGMGKMLGFDFLENFDRPYLATSVRDFWRRWHLSLSTFFRDYLYIPLGGSRGGHVRTGANLLVVFGLCGLWHGASWSFFLWGLLHGAFLCLERTGFGEGLERAPRALARAYTLGVVAGAWVLFRAPTLGAARAYYRALSGLGRVVPGTLDPLMPSWTLFRICLGAGLLACLPWDEWLGTRPRPVLAWVRVPFLLALYVLSIAEIAGGSYEAFIYYRF